jgi:hypothetical protein
VKLVKEKVPSRSIDAIFQRITREYEDRAYFILKA